MKKPLIPLLFAFVAIACSGDLPTGVDTFAPNFGVAGNSGCYTVSGALDLSGNPEPLAGTISGDVEGTVVNAAGPIISHGVVVFRSVDQTWEVTGGIVEPLIGQTVLFKNDFRGILAKLPLIRVNTTMRVAEGAQKGNLTLHGITDASAFPAVTSHLEYHGVICP